jgi:hypothetical protein
MLPCYVQIIMWYQTGLQLKQARSLHVHVIEQCLPLLLTANTDCSVSFYLTDDVGPDLFPAVLHALILDMIEFVPCILQAHSAQVVVMGFRRAAAVSHQRGYCKVPYLSSRSYFGGTGGYRGQCKTGYDTACTNGTLTETSTAAAACAQFV